MEEFKKQLCDRYSPTELVELLDLDTLDVVEAFWDYLVQFKLGDIYEDMGIEDQEDGDSD